MQTKERIIQCFNKGTTTYNAAADLQKKVAQKLARRLTGLHPEKILEIGCGTGLFSHHLLELFPRASFLLTDISPMMANICQERFILFPKIRTACMDGESLNLTAQFDLIVSSMTLHWFDSIQQGFSDILEKLAPEGRFMFAILGENSLPEWAAICKECNIPAATPFLPSIDFIKNLFPGLHLESEMVTQSYASCYAFLKHLKQLGAHASYADHVPVAAGKLRRVLRDFEMPIDISYQIIYGSYLKT